MEKAGMLSVERVCFSYRRGTLTLRDVSLMLGRNEIVGLVGANGSGKSTLIRAIFDLIQIQSGTIVLAGSDHRSVSAKCAGILLPSEDYLPEFLTGYEYLSYLHELYGVPLVEAEADGLFTALSMRGRGRDLIEDYSHGMRKKVQLLAAFLLQRPFTAIDETLNGIDFDALRVSEQRLRVLREQGTTVLLCSHDFGLLERTADRIILLDNGQVKGCFTVAEVRAQAGSLYSFVDERLPAGEVV